MKTPSTEIQERVSMITLEAPAPVFARSGFPGLHPDERRNAVGREPEATPPRPYGRRLNDYGQEQRRCIEFAGV
jgi:hypothetical protein